MSQISTFYTFCILIVLFCENFTMPVNMATTEGSIVSDSQSTLKSSCNITNYLDLTNSPSEMPSTTFEESPSLQCQLSMLTVYRIINRALLDKLYLTDGANYFLDTDNAMRVTWKSHEFLIKNEEMFYQVQCSCEDLNILKRLKFEEFKIDSIGFYIEV